VGAKLFHADGQTDRHDEANSWFSQIRESALNVPEFCWNIQLVPRSKHSAFRL
jgi:hypothetical protein